MSTAPDPASSHVLPDLLSQDQTLWFVGTAPGPRSAAERAYYAHPGNRFWPTLFATGITPRLFRPADYPELLDLGVGLTDVCKTAWGVDAALPADAFDPDGLSDKVARLRPRALAFTSKMAASRCLGVPTARIAVGRQPANPTGPVLFVLPSPSGLATSYWTLDPWREVAAWIRKEAP